MGFITLKYPGIHDIGLPSTSFIIPTQVFWSPIADAEDLDWSIPLAAVNCRVMKTSCSKNVLVCVGVGVGVGVGVVVGGCVRVRVRVCVCWCVCVYVRACVCACGMRGGVVGGVLTVMILHCSSL